jgi:LuxR family transcriptional regulator, maltose regulon positive regulatory protein
VPDYALAARLIDQSANALLKRGDSATLLQWIATLPDDDVLARPRLCLTHAWALFRGAPYLRAPQYAAIEARLNTAMQAPESHAGEGAGSARADAALLGEALNIQAFMALHRGDAPRAIELARQALEQLPAGDLDVRSTVGLSLGMACELAGDTAAAIGPMPRRAHSARPPGTITSWPTRCATWPGCKASRAGSARRRRPTGRRSSSRRLRHPARASRR